MNGEDSIFIVHTRQSRVHELLYQGAAAVCLELGLRVWDYYDFKFYERQVVDYDWQGVEVDPVRAVIGLPPFEVVRENPDRHELLALWLKSAALIVLHDSDGVTPGVQFELETLERGYLSDFKTATQPVVASVAIGTANELPLAAGAPLPFRFALPENAEEPALRREFVAACLLCWTVHRLQKASVAGAFVIEQASQDSESIAWLARSAPAHREFDFEEYAKRNREIEDNLRSTTDPVFVSLAAAALNPSALEIPGALRRVAEWLMANESKGEISKMGSILGHHVLQHYSVTSERFRCCMPFWMPELRD